MSRLTRVLMVLGWAGLLVASPVVAGTPPTDADVVQAFAKQGMRINPAEARGIRADVRLALEEARLHGIGNSKVDFAAVEIASNLGLDTSPGSNTVRPPACWDMRGTTTSSSSVSSGMPFQSARLMA